MYAHGVLYVHALTHTHTRIIVPFVMIYVLPVYTGIRIRFIIVIQRDNEYTYSGLFVYYIILYADHDRARIESASFLDKFRKSYPLDCRGPF